MSELFQTKPTAMTAVTVFYTSPIDCHCAFISHLDRDKRFCASPSEYLPPWLLPSQLMIPPQISPFRLHRDWVLMVQVPQSRPHIPFAATNFWKSCEKSRRCFRNCLVEKPWWPCALPEKRGTGVENIARKRWSRKRVGILLMPSPSTLTLFCVNGVLSGNQHFHRNQDDRFRVRNMTFKG